MLTWTLGRDLSLHSTEDVVPPEFKRSFGIASRCAPTSSAAPVLPPRFRQGSPVEHTRSSRHQRWVLHPDRLKREADSLAGRAAGDPDRSRGDTWEGDTERADACLRTWQKAIVRYEYESRGTERLARKCPSARIPAKWLLPPNSLTQPVRRVPSPSVRTLKPFTGGCGRGVQRRLCPVPLARSSESSSSGSRSVERERGRRAAGAREGRWGEVQRSCMLTAVHCRRRRVRALLGPLASAAALSSTLQVTPSSRPVPVLARHRPQRKPSPCPLRCSDPPSPAVRLPSPARHPNGVSLRAASTTTNRPAGSLVNTCVQVEAPRRSASTACPCFGP